MHEGSSRDLQEARNSSDNSSSLTVEDKSTKSAISTPTNGSILNIVVGDSGESRRIGEEGGDKSAEINGNDNSVNRIDNVINRNNNGSNQRICQGPFSGALGSVGSVGTSTLNLDGAKDGGGKLYGDGFRVAGTSSELNVALKAKSYSRYFLDQAQHNKTLHDMETPFYYYDETTPTNSTLGSNGFKSKIDDSRISELNSVPFEIGSRIEQSFEDVSSGNGSALEEQLGGSLNEKKREFWSKNLSLWFKDSTLGRILAVLILLSVTVFGSMAYVIASAHGYYKQRGPEVYEVLSPYKYPKLAALRSLVDPDTPQEFHLKTSIKDPNTTWELVFSDEFNAEGRTFHEGDDPFFTAVDIHYAATNDLEAYVPDMATTKNGTLQLTFDAFPTNGLNYRSAMLQSWNKMCFSNKAMVEVSLKMPAFSQSRGFWPGVWALGNLARPGYMASTDGVWPYTYDECDFGITPNQSSPDGISFLPGQKLNKCTCYGEDHPNIGVGRGAPEIDILEGTHDLREEWAIGAQTLQVAPFDPWWKPDYSYMSIHNSKITSMREDTGTPTQEAIAVGTVLNSTWFHQLRNSSDHSQILPHQTYFQRFGMEYLSEKTPEKDSYLQFYVADSPTLTIYGDALHPQGDIGWRNISKEPMSIVFNLGLSDTWLKIDFASLVFPAVLEVDYIRIYQPKGEHSITCDPQDYPTTDYIAKHINAYTNANLTSWKQAGYSFPKNSFMNGCEAPKH